MEAHTHSSNEPIFFRICKPTRRLILSCSRRRNILGRFPCTSLGTIIPPKSPVLAMLNVKTGCRPRHDPSQRRLREQSEDHPAVCRASSGSSGVQHPPQEVHLRSVQVNDKNEPTEEERKGGETPQLRFMGRGRSTLAPHLLRRGGAIAPCPSRVWGGTADRRSLPSLLRNRGQSVGDDDTVPPLL